MSRKHGWPLISQESFAVFRCSVDAGGISLVDSASERRGDECSIRRGEFQAKMENVISGIIQARRKESAKICFEWANDKGFNAFALKLSDERDNYLVCINAGVDETIESIANSPRFVSAGRVPESGVSLQPRGQTRRA